MVKVNWLLLLLLCLFKVRPLVLSKTLSQMWDRLNLPMLLLSVRLLTLLGKEVVYLRQAVRQVLTFPLGKEAIYLRQAFRQVLHSL